MAHPLLSQETAGTHTIRGQMMEWLADNWVILLAIGFVWFLCLGRGAIRCCGGGYGHGNTREDPEKEVEEKPIAMRRGDHPHWR